MCEIFLNFFLLFGFKKVLWSQFLSVFQIKGLIILPLHFLKLCRLKKKSDEVIYFQKTKSSTTTFLNYENIWFFSKKIRLDRILTVDSKYFMHAPPNFTLELNSWSQGEIFKKIQKKMRIFCFVNHNEIILLDN